MKEINVLDVDTSSECWLWLPVKWQFFPGGCQSVNLWEQHCENLHALSHVVQLLFTTALLKSFIFEENNIFDLPFNKELTIELRVCVFIKMNIVNMDCEYLLPGHSSSCCELHSVVMVTVQKEFGGNRFSVCSWRPNTLGSKLEFWCEEWTFQFNLIVL